MSRHPRRAPRLARALLLALATLTAGGACGWKRNEGSSAEEARPTTLLVRNQGFSDVNVFALRGGQRVRLGTVTGNSRSVLRIPSHLVVGAATPLRFLADPIGSNRTPISQEIVVNAGDQVDITIPPT